MSGLTRRIALAWLALGLFTGSVHAEAGESSLGLGLLPRLIAFDQLSALDGSVGGQLRYRFGLDDAFQLGLAVDAGATLRTPGFIGAATAELTYALDALTWVPLATFGAGVLVSDQAPARRTARADVLLTLGLGVAYRPARHFALELHARYEFLPTAWEDRTAGSLALSYVHFFE